MNMQIVMIPRSYLGKWSLGLAGTFMIAFIVFLVLTQVPTGFNGLPPGFDPLVAFIFAMVLVVISVATIVTGLISLIKHKERSTLVIGGMIITFWFGLVGAVGQYLI
ncbi:MAG: hypothetical protein JW856_02630 [Dehalococcoidales bacterium]|nr:hypothetical protein [Dehalococcoidales bacterium]